MEKYKTAMPTKKQKIIILFLDIFTDDEIFRKEIRKKLYKGGTYSEHMRAVFGLKTDQWQTIDASISKFPKKFPKVDALVIGGSAKDPVRGQNLPWMKDTYKFIRLAAKNNIPILGICGGLQFVVKALGGDIIYNPKGREFGTITINIRKSDQFLKGLGKKFMAQSNHRCITGKINFPSKILASSKMSPVQILAIGNNIRLVQFHPERSKQQTQLMAKQEENKKLLKSFKDTSRTDKLLINNFLNYFIYPRL